MPFKVSRSVQNNNTLIHLSDNNHSTGITVAPDAGALLHEFTIPVEGKPFNILENYPADKPLRDQVTFYYRSAKLSPWVCRLAAGHYRFHEKEFRVRRLFTDGTALHGLLFDQPFTVVDEKAEEGFASVSLRHHYKGYDPGYPFEYACAVRYTLRPQGALEITTTITNLHHEGIPIADGWHPYFALGGPVDGWQLQFPAKSMVEFNDTLVPTGRLLPFDRFNGPATIGAMKMDNCFLLDADAAGAACTLFNPANKVKVSFLPGATYPYLQIFIPDHRQSIAIENISSAPDSFNNLMGLTILPPAAAKTFSVVYVAGVEENV